MQPTFAAEAYQYPLIIRHLWHTALACRAQQEIVSDERRFSYRQIRDRIAALAAGLERLGVTAGDTVAVMDWDSHRYFECYFAIPMMGAVLHTINVRLAPEQILYTINHAEDDVILVHADFLPVVEQIRGAIERPVKFVFLADDASAPVPSSCDDSYHAMITTGAGFEFGDLDENTIATTFYTTGTTGEPKAVFYSHRQIVLHTLGLAVSLGSFDAANRLHGSDVYMPITPMFHVHAWGMPYVATLLGIKQVYPERYEPARLLQTIAAEGVTFSHCVPTILHMLLNDPQVDRVDLGGWKLVIGGSALPAGLARAALERGINLYTGYGLSETCPILTMADISMLGGGEDAETSIGRRCKTGVPAAMVDIRVVDEQMNDVPRGGALSGEIVVRAPWLTQGYAGNAETSDALWAGGYLHTGDVGYFDEQGALRVTDRLKDVIKSGGEWIASLALEDIVSRCAAVSEVAAFGIPDARWGERPLLALVAAAGYSSEQASTEARAAIAAEIERGGLSSWAMPERCEVLDSLPRTSVGKLDKKRLRQQYADPQNNSGSE